MPVEEDYNWKCPHCAHDVTITEQRMSRSTQALGIANADGLKMLTTQFIVCPNKECRRITLNATLWPAVRDALGNASFDKSKSPEDWWQLVPKPHGRNFPDYVPQAIRSDYEEACAIRDLSPKASATLARRALQGIIRDFWKVKSGRLVDEIAQLQEKIDPVTWEAIESVRKVGNIGAHMERDINVIVDVEPNEAQLLTGLIETLVDDTYIASHKRRQQLAAIIEMAKTKTGDKKSGA